MGGCGSKKGVRLQRTQCWKVRGSLCFPYSVILPPSAAETCEELFTPRAPHIELALSGVEIFSNGSGSHHQLRKLDQRLDLIRGATAKV